MKTAENLTALLKSQEQTLRDAVSFAIETAQKAGATAEVGVTKVSGLSVSTRLQEIENVEFTNDGALGISVYLGQQKGNASTSDLSEEAIKNTVEAALAIAKYTSPDDCTGLADKELMAFEAPDLELYHGASVDVEQATKLALEAEKSALEYDAKIVNSNGASFNSHTGVRVYGNTHGMLQSYLSSRYSLSCSVIGGELDQLENDYEYTVSREFDALSSADWVGQNCAKKVIARLNPQKLSTREVPVIFLNDVATGLISHLTGAISGGSLYRKSSFLLDHLGKQVLPDWFQISERPHLLRRLASTPFDSEGVRTQNLEIIQDGVLQTYLLTSYSGRKMGMQSTGHAGGIHNWRIAGQGLSFEQMLKEMGTGLVVTELMGQGVSAITGDYSRGAAGFWVENGEIQYPVSEITIAGNLKDMWRNIVTVGNDIETRSNIQCGSVLLSEMKIAGQ